MKHCETNRSETKFCKFIWLHEMKMKHYKFTQNETFFRETKLEKSENLCFIRLIDHSTTYYAVCTCTL